MNFYFIDIQIIKYKKINLFHYFFFSAETLLVSYFLGVKLANIKIKEPKIERLLKNISD